LVRACCKTSDREGCRTNSPPRGLAGAVQMGVWVITIAAMDGKKEVKKDHASALEQWGEQQSVRVCSFKTSD
jgi:hypothetical protein